MRVRAAVGDLARRVVSLEQTSGGDREPFGVVFRLGRLYEVDGELMTEAEYREWAAGVGFVIVIRRREDA